MSPEERWSFLEARRLEIAAEAQLREFMPDLAVEGQDLEAEHNDALITGDGELFDKVIDEAGRRGDAWKSIVWYEWLAKKSREERDMSLLRSATTSIKLAARQEFLRREGGADNPKQP